MKSKYVPFRNYAIALIIASLAVLFSLYSFSWYKIYQEEQTRESYLVTSNTISMQIEDIKNLKTVLSEAPSNYFIYISYLHDTDILNLEKKLKKVIDEYGINDIVYYVNATKIKRDNDYLSKLNQNLNLKENTIKSIPCIIYVNNGEIKEENIIQNPKILINATDLENLIKKNNIDKKNQ